MLICRKKTSTAFSQLEAWNRIIFEVNKVGLTN